MYDTGYSNIVTAALSSVLSLSHVGPLAVEACFSASPRLGMSSLSTAFRSRSQFRLYALLRNRRNQMNKKTARYAERLVAAEMNT